jgi:hypothetical protein
MRHPMINALIVIAMGGGLLVLLLQHLDKVLDILDVYYPGRAAKVSREVSSGRPGSPDHSPSRPSSNESGGARTGFAGGYLGCSLLFPASRCSRRRPIDPAILRVQGFAALGSASRAALLFGWEWQLRSLRSGSSWVSGSFVTAIHIFHRLLRGFSRPTGLACSTVVTALPRNQNVPDLGWVYYFMCDCGVVGRGHASPDGADADAREHAPGQIPIHDIPPEARQSPPTAFPV